MNNTIDHQKLVDELLFAFGSRPDVRCWKRVVGVFESFGRTISVGIPGESDLQGIVKPNGRFLAIEVKTGKAVLNKNQEKFRDMVRAFGGIYILARDVDSAIADFERQL